MGGMGPVTETVTVRAGQRGRHAGANGERARQAQAGGQGKLGTVGRACTTIPGGLRVGRCQLYLAPTTFATATRKGWRRHSGGMSQANMGT